MQEEMVSIITVNYNGFKDTCEFIDSLVQHETFPYEIIVVDNASSENEAEKLKQIYPLVCTVRSEVNLGFAGGNNLGFRYAKGSYILYMNNDMIVHAPFLKPLVDRLCSSSDIGVVSPKIKYSYATDVIQYAGYTSMSSITIRNNLIGVGEKDLGQYDQAKETAFAHGACMMTSRAILEKIGVMAEVYFLFYEELDWSLQAQRAGYIVWYEPRSTVFHKESMSIKRGTPLRCYYLTRSRLLFARRNTSGIQRFLSCSYQLLFALPKNVISYVLHGERKMAFAFGRGVWHGLFDLVK